MFVAVSAGLHHQVLTSAKPRLDLSLNVSIGVSLNEMPKPFSKKIYFKVLSPRLLKASITTATDEEYI